MGGAGAVAAGRFRRTPAERADQRLSWERSDQAFFAAGACHVLAWACRERFPERAIEVMAMYVADEERASHLYARWVGWAFDHSGWHPEHEVLEVNAQFERRPVTGHVVVGETGAFYRRNHLRPTDQFWADPRPRGLAYVDRFEVPWHRDPRP